MEKKTLIVSAVNQIDGGTLKIVEDFLGFANDNCNDLKITALINAKVFTQFKNRFKNIKFIRFSIPKKNWIFRIIFENIYCYYFALKHNVNYWVSLHDLTPKLPKNVISCVYCHNPSPIHKLSILDFLSPKFILFVFFYKYIYALNIKRNKFVITQQEWLSNYFKKSMGISNLLILRPDTITNKINIKKLKSLESHETLHFIYPCLPRTYKNIEVIVKACYLLETYGVTRKDCIIYITIGRYESLYCSYIRFIAKKCSLIEFTGRMKHSDILNKFAFGTQLIFPSKLETWGLPLSEAKSFETNIIAADLEYAKETLNNFSKVDFFNPYDHEELCNIIKRKILRKVDNKINKLKNRQNLEEKKLDPWPKALMNNLCN